MRDYNRYIYIYTSNNVITTVITVEKWGDTNRLATLNEFLMKRKLRSIISSCIGWCHLSSSQIHNYFDGFCREVVEQSRLHLYSWKSLPPCSGWWWWCCLNRPFCQIRGNKWFFNSMINVWFSLCCALPSLMICRRDTINCPIVRKSFICRHNMRITLFTSCIYISR